MKDIYFIFRREFYLVFRDHAVLTFFIFLCLGYPLIYTFIYSNEVVRQVPVAVIDQSKSPLSREFLRMWEASPNVKVVAHCNDLGEAQLFMWQKEIYGILEIPADFSKDINRGEQAHVALFCDMGALLNYKALLQATSDVAITLGKEIQVENLPYASRIQQEITASPVEISEVKMFNPQSGFASFIIPAVLILVIQQSLLLGVGTIAGTVMATYIGMLSGGDPVARVLFAKHLISASLMAAPGSIVLAKMLCPQTEVVVDQAASLEKGSSHPTALDALASGTSTGIRLMVNIAAMLLVFIALVALANYLLEGLLGRYTGLNEWIVSVTDGKAHGLTFQFILGIILAPFMWLIGIPSPDIMLVGSLLGQKTILNEFVAYFQLQECLCTRNRF